MADCGLCLVIFGDSAGVAANEGRARAKTVGASKKSLLRQLANAVWDCSVEPKAGRENYLAHSEHFTTALGNKVSM